MLTDIELVAIVAKASISKTLVIVVVVSFTREFDTFTGQDSVLHLEWAGGSNGEVHLRANSLRPRLY